MSIWLFRAGKNGEYEEKFLTDNRIYLTWKKLKIDLKDYKDRVAHFQKLQELYPSEKINMLKNWESQIYPLAHRMKIEDWIVLQSKRTSTIHIGKVIGEYTYDVNNSNPYYHYRNMDWFAKDIPRNNFKQDFLYSFGAFMTVCKITRNDAEKRIKAMAENDWKVSGVSNTVFQKLMIRKQIPQQT